ncbi:MAG: hypothetical protein WA151_15355, partial [Desulfatirhabdiaceae bacterium]
IDGTAVSFDRSKGGGGQGYGIFKQAIGDLGVRFLTIVTTLWPPLLTAKSSYPKPYPAKRGFIYDQ